MILIRFACISVPILKPRGARAKYSTASMSTIHRAMHSGEDKSVGTAPLEDALTLSALNRLKAASWSLCANCAMRCTELAGNSPTGHASTKCSANSESKEQARDLAKRGLGNSSVCFNGRLHIFQPTSWSVTVSVCALEVEEISGTLGCPVESRSFPPAPLQSPPV